MNHSIDEIESVRKDMASLVEKLGSMLRGIMGAKKEEVPSGGAVIEEAPATLAPAESDGEVNKSALVRDYFKKHGHEVRNKDVVEGIKSESGVEVAPSLVSYIKGRLEQKVESEKKETAKKAPKAKTPTSRVLSGSALIREYFEAHGADASNEEVVNYIKKTKGVEIKPTLVSSVRAILKKKGVKTSKIRVVSKKFARKGPTMPAAVIETLKKAGREGLELSEITHKVLKSGYEYKGGKGIAGVTQNVFQALHNLSKKIAHPGFKGNTPVVIHEKTAGQRVGRYRLNPKALKNKVA